MPWIGTDQFGNPYDIVVNAPDLGLLITPAPGQTPSTSSNALSVLALDVISGALRLIGVLAAGEQISNDDANDGLFALDQMLDAWNADGLTIFTTRTDEYALVAGQQAYTLGPGGDFNSNRPAQITGMSAILLDNPDNPIEVPMTEYSVDDWQTKVPVKAVSSTFPQIWYDTGDFPLRTINLWPYPNASTNHLRIYSWQALGIPSDIHTLLSFPPGYQEAFRYNLAIRLAPEFERQPSPFVQANALESLATLRRMNAPDMKLRSDLIADQGGYNYRQDMFNIPY